MNPSYLRATAGVPKRRERFVAMLTVAGVLVVATVAKAEAAGSRPSGGPRALALSVSPDPIPVRAGKSVETRARVVNPGDAPVSVTVSSRELSFGNDGHVEMGPRPDRRWQRLVHFPTRKLTIPAQSYLDIPVKVQVPRSIRPDLYFIGFLVTPIPTGSGSLQVINQIGSFITIDVPGPRLRKLAAAFDLSSLVLATHVRGTLRVANVGRAAVRFWGENDTTSSPGGSLQQQRLDPSLLPIGKSRLVTVSGKPAWPVGFVTMTVHIFYPGRTESATKELTYTKRVLVVNPFVPVGLAVLLLAGVSTLWFVRRHRQARGQTLVLDAP